MQTIIHPVRLNSPGQITFRFVISLPSYASAFGDGIMKMSNLQCGIFLIRGCETADLGLHQSRWRSSLRLLIILSSVGD